MSSLGGVTPCKRWSLHVCLGTNAGRLMVWCTWGAVVGLGPMGIFGLADGHTTFRVAGSDIGPSGQNSWWVRRLLAVHTLPNAMKVRKTTCHINRCTLVG